MKGKTDPASLETLESVFFTFQNPEFPGRGKTRSVLIPATGKRLKFTFWLQPEKAPVVYIIPGLGSHRLAASELALAELVYRQGFSAVNVSSTFNFEFMEHASTADVPAYMPVDVHDLHVALTEIDHRLEKLYPKRLGLRALMGYSMGAFQSLLVAATESTNEAPLIKFDRYVAINSPVQLLYGIAKLDEYYKAPLGLARRGTSRQYRKHVLKGRRFEQDLAHAPNVVALQRHRVQVSDRIDLSAHPSRRHLQQPAANQPGSPGTPDQEMAAGTIVSGNPSVLVQDYLQKFLIPYYWTWGIELSTPDSLENASNLRTYAAGLKTNPKIRLIVNRDDFLLPEEDLAWLKTTFAGDQLTVFEQGGHLGNLSHPAVQKAILRALAGLQSSPPKSD